MFTSRLNTLPLALFEANGAMSAPAESSQFDPRTLAGELLGASPEKQDALIALVQKKDIPQLLGALYVAKAPDALKNKVRAAENVGATPVERASTLKKRQETVQRDTVTANERQRILAMFRDSSNPNEREVAKQAIQAKESHDTGVAQVKKETVQNTADERKIQVRREYVDQPVKIEYDKNGELTTESMISLLSDLDGMSGVEKTNRGIFRRALFGGSKQKEVVGEQQLKTLLSGKSRSELDAIFQRVTGNAIPLPWGATTANQSGEVFSNNAQSRYAFTPKDRELIESFQTGLISESEIVADIMGIVTGNPDARAGLRAVIEPNGKEQLQKYLNDPKNAQKIADALANSEVLKREPEMLDTILGTLLKIGIMIPVSILSKGVVGGYIEQGTIDAKKSGGVTGSLSNLTAKAGIGESGSVAASLDLAGARLEANWNDPQMRISNRVSYVVDAEDPKKASEELTDKVVSESKDDKNINSIRDISEQYLNAQKQLLALPDSEARRDAVAHNTMSYLTRVEQAKGVQLKGIFAGFTKTGWMLGLSGSIVDRSGNFDKVNTGAAKIEGQALGAEKISTEEEQQILKEVGVVLFDGGAYQLPDGRQILPKRDEKVIFHFDKIVGDEGITYTVSDWKIVPKNATVQSDVKTVKMGRKNTEGQDAYIAENTKNTADLVKNLRSTHGTNMGKLEGLVSDENYDQAKQIFENILRTSKHQDAQSLLKRMQGLKDGEEKTFFDDVLRLTSGSNASRRLANELRSGKNVAGEVDKFYKNGLAKQFGEIYGVSESSIQNQFDAMKGSISKDSIQTLGNAFRSGFTGLVSYSQLDGTGRNIFKRADKVDNARAQMVGTPTEVTDPSLLAGVKNQLKARMTPADIASYRETAAVAGITLSDADIKSLVIDGTIPESLKRAGYILKASPKISSYLSFEESAECFNMGFVLEPIELKKVTETVTPTGESTMNTGSVVGVSDGHILNFGIGGGAQWDKPRKPKDPDGTDPTTPTEPPVEPPKPPVEPPKPPVEPPKPPVEPPKPPVEPPKPPVEPPGVGTIPTTPVAPPPAPPPTIPTPTPNTPDPTAF